MSDVGHRSPLLVPRLAWAWLDSGFNFDLVIVPILVVVFLVYLWGLRGR